MTDKYIKVVATWDDGEAEDWFDKKLEFFAAHTGLPNVRFSTRLVDYPPLRSVPQSEPTDEN